MSQVRYQLSAKVLIRDDEGRFLLLKRSMSSNANRGRWDLPGGKVDAGEAFDVALLREVVEELGLTVSLERVAGAAESVLPDRHVAYIIMEGRRLSGEVRLSGEHDAYAWVERSRLSEMDVCDQFRPLLAACAGQEQKVSEGIAAISSDTLEE